MIFTVFGRENFKNKIKYGKPLLKKVLNTEFTSLLNGSPIHSIDNHLSIDQKDSRIAFAFSKVNDNNFMSLPLKRV